VLSTALGAVDMALWDIKGKALGLPVYELLGGKVKDTLVLYANGWFSGAKEPEEFAEKAVETVAQGFRALKWDPFGSLYLYVTRKDLHDIEANVRSVREAVGESIDLIIEGHGRFNLTGARKIAEVLTGYNPSWFEEPIIPGNNQALADLRRGTRIPIVAGERAYSSYDAYAMLQSDSVDIFQPDAAHIGGITELKRIAAISMVHSISISPHNPNGPIANMATVQFAASCENFYMLETMNTDVPWRKELFDEDIEFRNGCFIIPNGPGLNIDVREE